MVPNSMLGWWITPELASGFEILPDAFVPDNVELEATEDD